MTAPAQARPVLRELVVCSLEPWDEVWRRNQLLVSQLLEIEQHLRVLFVGPAVDAGYELVAHGQLRRGGGRSSRPGPHPSGRVATFGPTKWLPRSAGTGADRLLARSVERAARAVGFERPLLWINNLSLALLAEKTGWPTLYDVTDDWLLASCTERERRRRIRDEALLMRLAREVVVCSPGLVATKGRHRPVKLVSNGVDSDWVRSPTARPSDMPAGPVACYIGTLHEDRLDVELCLRVAEHLEGRGSLLFVGPDALTDESRGALIGKGNIVILGSRSHAAVPGYLQHADVLVVPHRRTPFTESLDPIKAYEYRAVGRPVVATPVAGFRDLGPPVTVAEDSDFADAVLAAVPGRPPPPILLGLPSDMPTWLSQGMKMHEALLRVASA